MWTRLTKQGVPDLGNNTAKRKEESEFSPLNQCEHKNLRPCCSIQGCGHIECPDCGLFIDSSAELQGKWVW